MFIMKRLLGIAAAALMLATQGVQAQSYRYYGPGEAHDRICATWVHAVPGSKEDLLVQGWVDGFVSGWNGETDSLGIS
jgi:hypothetical protein